MNILILKGGNSPEREASLRTAENVANAAAELGYAVKTYDTIRGLKDAAQLIEWADIVFPALHGKGGEDGTVQDILESYPVPYVGSGPEASRRCFDKIRTKQTLLEKGLLTPLWEEVDAQSFLTSELIHSPYVLKPNDSGSSIDVIIVREPATHNLDLRVFQRHKIMLLEELISGVEITVPVLGNDALPVIEIIPPSGEEFDHDNKYNGKSQELCPPQNVSETIQKKAQSLALQAHRILGARHFSRTDFMLSSNGELYILELNTIPGLTEQSLLPKAAQAAGLDMTKLVKRLVDLAFKAE